MKVLNLKQSSFLKRKNSFSSFIINLSKSNININQSQILSYNSAQKIFIVSPNELESILFDKKEYDIVDLMQEAERKIQQFAYHEAEIIYNLLNNAIFPKHLNTFKTYFAKVLTGLGYIAFNQARYNESLNYFRNAKNYWEQVNNYAQVVYCLQMIGVVYRFRNKKGDDRKSLAVLEEGIFFSNISTGLPRSLRSSMIGNILRDKSEILLQAGHYEQSYKVAEQSLNHLENFGRAIYSYTNFVKRCTLFKLSHYDQALSQLDDNLNQIESNPIFKLRCHTFLMEIFMDVFKNQSESYKYFTKAIEAAGECGNLIEARNLYIKAKKYDFLNRLEFQHRISDNKKDFNKSYDYFSLL